MKSIMSRPVDTAGPKRAGAVLGRRWGHLCRSPVGLALLIGLALAQVPLWIFDLPLEHARSAFAWRAALGFALQLAGVAIAWNRRDQPTLVVVVLFAVVFRVAAFSWPPVLSDDLYRYVWDGRVQMAGVSPYAGPPNDSALVELRDAAIWPHINRPGAVTVYPPGAQMAFVSLAAVGGDSVDHVKGAAFALEFLALLMLAWMVRRRGVPIGRLILYAWSPLVIAEVCVSGHLDALLLPLVVVGIGLAERGRAYAVGAVFGTMALLKLYPLILVAALPRRMQARALLAAGGVIVCGYLPYALWAGTGVVGFLPKYVGVAEDFNMGTRAGVQALLALALPHARQIAMLLCATAMLGLLLTLPRLRPGRSAHLWSDGRRVVMTFLLLLPTAVHPWYALWLVPFLAIRPSAAGVWLIGTLPLSYLKYDAPGELMPTWVLVVEWVPALALVLGSWLQSRSLERSRSDDSGCLHL